MTTVTALDRKIREHKPVLCGITQLEQIYDAITGLLRRGAYLSTGMQTNGAAQCNV